MPAYKIPNPSHTTSHHNQNQPISDRPTLHQSPTTVLTEISCAWSKVESLDKCSQQYSETIGCKLQIVLFVPNLIENPKACLDY